MKFQLKGNYFHGSFHMPKTKGPLTVERYIQRHSPADTNTLLWDCPVDYNHCGDIIESAQKGYKTWRSISVDERIQYLKRYQEQLLVRVKDIAEAIALEAGKPIWEATGEANALVGKVDVTINHSLPRIQSQFEKDIMPGVDGRVTFKPIGPCVIIGPFNFPCHLANTQILSSLIAGNSIIFKPSEKTCYSAQLMFECLAGAGFPEGVVNLLQGDGESARRLISEKAVKGVFFTGSKEVGLKILQTTQNDLSKLVALELGGKNPAIICEDAKLEPTIAEMLQGCFLTTGQRCTSTSIVLLHRSHVDQFVDRFHQLSKKIIVDHPIDHEQTPLMGPLIDKKSLDTYLLFMGMAKREGFTEIMRGKHLSKKYQGHYVSPSIHLAETFNPDSHFLASEIFGPNCTIVPFDDLDEAIDIANSTEYGLASCVFTEKKEVFEKCLWEIESGLVNWNKSTCGASPKLPFGGVKNSGNYHPMAVASIDACVYQMTTLVDKEFNTDLSKVPGLKLD
jgi:succinylglutamic semialdehyde dehydrogenase